MHRMHARSHAHSFSRSLAFSCAHSLTDSLTHWLTDSWLTDSLTHLLTHPPTHPPNHSLTHSLSHSPSLIVTWVINYIPWSVIPQNVPSWFGKYLARISWYFENSVYGHKIMLRTNCHSIFRHRYLGFSWNANTPWLSSILRQLEYRYVY